MSSLLADDGYTNVHSNTARHTNSPASSRTAVNGSQVRSASKITKISLTGKIVGYQSNAYRQRTQDVEHHSMSRITVGA